MRFVRRLRRTRLSADTDRLAADTVRTRAGRSLLPEDAAG